MTEMTPSYDADHYVPRLDLAEDPFDKAFDSDYFYDGAMRRQLLEQIVHYGKFSDQVVVLLGASGVGSSTLLDHLLPELQSSMDWCVVEGDVETTPEQLLVSLCDQLRFAQHSSASISNFLASLKTYTHVEGSLEPILVAVDQAHFMELETFQLLKQLVDGAEGAIHLLLVGEYQVEQLTQLAQFNNDKVKVLVLEPLSASEVAEYVLGMLRSVGYAGEMPLSPDQLAVLYEKSKGNMAAINSLMPTLLEATPSNHAEQFRAGIPMAHIAAILAVSLVLLVAWFSQGERDGNESLIEGGDQSQAIKGKQSSVPVTVIPKQASSASIDDSSAKVAVDKEPVSLIQTHSPSESVEQIQLERTSGMIIRKAQHSEVNGKDVEVVEPDSQQSKIIVASQGKGDVEVIKADHAAPVLSSTENQSVGVESAEPKPSGTASIVQVVAKPAPVNLHTSPTLQKKKGASDVPIREQRLLSFAETDYVLQLMGAVDEQRARNFVKQYVGRLPITYFEARLKGRPWFVVVTGPYASKAEAYAGVKLLPIALQKQKPWVRSMVSVQKDIRTNRF